MILVELRDITTQRETERRIQELNEALQEHAASLEAINLELEAFTHSVSHDLRTPLRLTNKIAHLLLQDHATRLPDDAVEKVNMILDSTREMAKLIEDLLTFSRVSREPMKKRRVDLGRLARKALEELHEEQLGREVNIEMQDIGSRPRGPGPQVFVNLLANALKFTRPREKAQVVVGRKTNGGEMVYFVRDNGVGFDMAEYDSLFLPFHRLHKAEAFEGSGVGLALVRRVIERHSGRIWAEGEVDLGERRSTSRWVVSGSRSYHLEQGHQGIDEGNEAQDSGRGRRCEASEERKVAARKNGLRGGHVQRWPRGSDLARSFAPDMVILDVSLDDSRPTTTKPGTGLRSFDVCEKHK